LGIITFKFQEPFLKFLLEGNKIELRVLIGKLGKIISYNCMKNILKKGKRGVIAQLCSLDVQISKSSISLDIQRVLDNHSKVFETLKGLPPIHDHDHDIHMIRGSFPPNIRPSKYLDVQKSEIECIVVEVLDAGIIQPSKSCFSSLVVLVHKKNVSWHMFLDY